MIESTGRHSQPVEILVVEDSLTQAEHIRYILERNGYLVAVARDGQQALQRLAERTPTMVISDIVMPAMDGYELCRQIKAQERFRNVPVILLTSLSDPADVIKGLECGADNFITKPYDEEYLLARIRYILANRELRQEGRLQIGAEILFGDRRYFISSDRQQILDLLISTYEAAIQKNQELVTAQEELQTLNERLEIMVEERTAALKAEVAMHEQSREALRTSEARYRTLAQQAVEAIYLFDMASCALVDANPAFLQLLGYQAEEIPGMYVYDFVADSQENIDALTTEIYTKQTLSLGERCWRRKDGLLVDVEVTATRIREGGRDLAFVIGRDITEWVKREREREIILTIGGILRTASSKQEMLQKLLDELLNSLQIDGTAVAMSRSAAQKVVVELGCGVNEGLTGLQLPVGVEMVGDVLRSAQLFVNNDVATDPGRIRPDFLGDGIHAVSCVPLITNDGTIGALLACRKTPFAEDDVRLLVAIADMAANAIHRATLHERVIEQARQVQKIVENVPEGMLLLNADHRVLLANPMARHYLADLSSAVIGDRLTHLYHEPLETFLGPVAPGSSWHELVLEESKSTFEVAAWPIEKGAQLDGWVLLLRDVTEERRQQEHIQAQYRLATVGQLAAGIAHDFNNIMAVITLYSQALEYNPDSPKRQQRLKVISEQARHAANLIGQILDFSRASVMARSYLDLLPFLKEVIKLLKRTLPENVIVELTAEPGRYVIDGDPTRLQQALMNLAINAHHAMPDGGRLYVTLTQQTFDAKTPPPLPNMNEGDWLRLSVEDTGSGIPDHVRPHIFEPFFTTKKPGEGTGLGLAQVYGIVKQHDGDIQVDSKPEEGTRFTIYLPVHSEEVTLTEEVVEELPPQAQNQETILLVEDDVYTRGAIQDTLLTLGYNVLIAGNGNEALSLYEAHRDAIDLILSDMVMPEMGGVQLYQALQAQQYQVKLILMSGYPLRDQGRMFLERGGIVWIQKPFSAGELARKLRQVIDQ